MTYHGGPLEYANPQSYRPVSESWFNETQWRLRAMTRRTVEKNFVNHNVHGTGPDRGVSGNWAYRGHTLCYQNQPYKRFVVAADGKKIMLIKEPAYTPLNCSKVSQLTRASDHQYWWLPEIGVHSRHYGDEMTEIELHARMMKRFLMEVQSVKEERLRYASAGNWHAQQPHAMPDFFERLMASHYDRWQTYQQLFGLNWGRLSPLYAKEVHDEACRKAYEYHTPEAKEKRERAEARREAKKALGLQ